MDAGKAYGIPVPLLAKYKIGRPLVEGDIVTVKRCYEKYVSCNVLSLALLTGLRVAFPVFLLLPVLAQLAELIVYPVKSCLCMYVCYFLNQTILPDIIPQKTLRTFRLPDISRSVFPLWSQLSATTYGLLVLDTSA